MHGHMTPTSAIYVATVHDKWIFVSSGLDTACPSERVMPKWLARIQAVTNVGVWGHRFKCTCERHSQLLPTSPHRKCTATAAFALRAGAPKGPAQVCSRWCQTTVVSQWATKWQVQNNSLGHFVVLVGMCVGSGSSEMLPRVVLRFTSLLLLLFSCCTLRPPYAEKAAAATTTWAG